MCFLKMKIFPESSDPDEKISKREELERLFRILNYGLIGGFSLVFAEIYILYFLPEYRTIVSPSFIILYPIFAMVTLWISLKVRNFIK